jgi:hypothetical protein
MTKYKSITVWEPAVATDEFHQILEDRIAILKSEGKTDGERVVTRPKPHQRVVERIWADQASAQEWNDWLEANVWPKAKESKVLPV